MSYKVDSYRFGEVVVNGVKYTSDVIVFWNKVKPNWWRIEGHALHLDDIKEVFAENPEVIVVGTGAYGIMEVKPEVEQYAKSKGIELIKAPTSEACKIYNKLIHEGKRAVAALHLTC
ncbi:MAG: hypothetical protein DRJ31_04985 [Candidatus Methanomethylicota archaeon]|uniref:Mth938-like domain-containing protein n=1 Tax=Thermoproteota archaeon TaxID=2056631 RepID=A0A497EQC9_9CREN|nr:MAG: hypothetical protein DRJ31_04985 [Candidatus Verstraetearchaeota archaeon]RLE53531.1 MAG: hypothetical protein DRJ33_00795 [Candidatus Verstraetearchaeota archaeon]